MIFSAMSGVAQADAAGLGLIEIKAMRERGFDPAFSAAVSASSAIIGPIIPPSVIMVIYGLLAQVSVATCSSRASCRRPHGPVADGHDLFPRRDRAGHGAGGAAGVVQRGEGELPRRDCPRFWRPIMLVGGLMLGVATPTELGALTVVYAGVAGLLVSAS